MARKRPGKASGPRRAQGAQSAVPGVPGDGQPSATPADPGTASSAGRTAKAGGGSSGRGLGAAQRNIPSRSAPRQRQQSIPDAVANRMARRIAIATGIPTLMGMGVFIASYVVVSRGLLDIPPSTTLLASGACFLLGLVGLSYGVLSSSWEDTPGSLLGSEQLSLNISRLRESIRAMRRSSSGSPGDPQG